MKTCLLLFTGFLVYAAMASFAREWWLTGIGLCILAVLCFLLFVIVGYYGPLDTAEDAESAEKARRAGK